MSEETLYVLTRTSGRPSFFKRCRETVEALTWPGPKVHIVHTDDPRDLDHIKADILIKGECLTPAHGRGYYNKYNNRLLEAIPGKGWVHFMDDDDEYLGPDVLNWLHGADRTVLHVFKTRRKQMSRNQAEVIFPRDWKGQSSFQTECFAMWSTIATKYKWWARKGGDHQYTRQITRTVKIAWNPILATQAQECKGHGRRMDSGGETAYGVGNLDPEREVYFKMFKKIHRDRPGDLVKMKARRAEKMEACNNGRITFKGVSVERLNHN